MCKTNDNALFVNQQCRCPHHLSSSTSYSSISTLKYCMTFDFSASAHSGSIIKRTAPSRPRSPGLGLSSFAATGVSGWTPPFSGIASLLLSLKPLMVLVLVSFLSAQWVYRGKLCASASWFKGMRTVRNRSGGKCGPTVVAPRWWV